MTPRLLLLLILFTSMLVAPGCAATLVKHTVSGAGTFEHGRGLRAEVNRATFHPIDQHFALSVSGRMGWVITGQWTRRGSEVVLVVSNMNNSPARGSGALKLDARGNVESLKVAGSTQGGAYKVKFKTSGSATASGIPPTVRLGPATALTPSRPAAAREDAAFDRSRRGRGAIKIADAPPVYLDSAEVNLQSTGRVSVRAHGAGETFRFEGTAGSGGSRAALDLVLHAVAQGTGVVTGTAHMDRSGRAVEEIELQGWLGGRPFQLSFRAR